MQLLTTSVRSALAVLVAVAAAQDRWCGKIYKAGFPAVDPGGRLEPPIPSTKPLLDLQIFPRHSIYVASETRADFIIDAGISYTHGSPWSGQGADANDGKLHVTVEFKGSPVAAGAIAVNTTGNLLSFDPSAFKAQMEGHPITVTATCGGTTYTASTELFYLPEKDTGSVVKIDNLHGSLLYRNPTTSGAFKPIFPYGFYADYSGFFNQSAANIEAYAAQGFNVVNVVEDFAGDDMTAVLDTMDRLNLFLQYDMRNSYRNLTSVAQQVPLVKDHPSLLTWYTADEPDGWQYDRNSTRLAYDVLAALDKYHPTALVLNCQNYFFAEYAAGADIVMEDAYPVGINATFSRKWDTPCNETLGDCGCDNCVGALLDVPDRVDDLRRYGAWLGGAAARKPVWEVPQAFSGEQYWARDPTPDEAWAMDLMAFNHGAKGRLAWLYPPSTALAEAASRLARVVTRSPVVDFLAGADPVLLHDAKEGGLDAAFWSLDHGALVCVVNPTDKTVDLGRVDLPGHVKAPKVVSEPWGNVRWVAEGSKLVAQGGLPGLSTSCVILE